MQLSLPSGIRCPACNTTLSMCVAEAKGAWAASLGFRAAVKAPQKRPATRGRHTKGRIATLGGWERRACARVRQVFSTYWLRVLATRSVTYKFMAFATTVLINIICKYKGKKTSSQLSWAFREQNCYVSAIHFQHQISGFIAGNKVQQCKCTEAVCHAALSHFDHLPFSVHTVHI